jgi:hypothetical protein
VGPRNCAWSTPFSLPDACRDESRRKVATYNEDRQRRPKHRPDDSKRIMRLFFIFSDDDHRLPPPPWMPRFTKPRGVPPVGFRPNVDLRHRAAQGLLRERYGLFTGLVHRGPHAAVPPAGSYGLERNARFHRGATEFVTPAPSRARWVEPHPSAADTARPDSSKPDRADPRRRTRLAEFIAQRATSPRIAADATGHQVGGVESRAAGRDGADVVDVRRTRRPLELASAPPAAPLVALQDLHSQLPPAGRGVERTRH